MNFAQEYLQLAQSIMAQIEIPAVAGIHLPRPVEEEQKADEFGFVFLEDGTAAPFYTSLDDALEQLWKKYPDGHSCQVEIRELIEYLDSDEPSLNALALGAFNAMSQHVMARAGYSPAEFRTNPNPLEDSSARRGRSTKRIAMVGYFRPMIARLLEQGNTLLVLEKNPARVELQAGVELTTNPADLLNFDRILCTASTLINGTLGEILQYKKESAHFSLIGPSGSGLPDVLFQHAVDDVGGILIQDVPALKVSLEKQESWSHAGQKYQLSQQQYPGITDLLETILQQST
jgi:uncharacterized protein